MAVNNFMIRWDETNKKWEASEDAGAYYDLVERPTLEDVRLNDATAPTGAAGRSHLWHDSIEGEPYLLNETDLIKRRPHDDRPASCGHFDDFISCGMANPAAGNATNLGDYTDVTFLTSTGNGQIVQFQGGANYPGTVYFNTGGVVDGDYGIIYMNRVAYPILLSNLCRFGAYVYLPAGLLLVANDLRLGMGDSLAVKPGDGIFFEKLTGDTNWFAVTGVGAAYTRTDTGVAVSNTFRMFEVDCTDATSIKFYISKLLVATHTTNLPTASMQLFVQNRFKAGGANAAIHVDCWYYDLKATR